MVSHYRTVMDYIGLAESVTKKKFAYKTIIDYLGMLESKSKHKHMFRIVMDSIGLIHRVSGIHYYAHRSKYWDKEYPKQRVRVNP